MSKCDGTIPTYVFADDARTVPLEGEEEGEEEEEEEGEEEEGEEAEEEEGEDEDETCDDEEDDVNPLLEPQDPKQRMCQVSLPATL
mgnify:CR=1 FL=1